MQGGGVLSKVGGFPGPRSRESRLMPGMTQAAMRWRVCSQRGRSVAILEGQQPPIPPISGRFDSTDQSPDRDQVDQPAGSEIMTASTSGSVCSFGDYYFLRGGGEVAIHMNVGSLSIW